VGSLDQLRERRLGRMNRDLHDQDLS
jgi:hypothetical protein